MDEAGLAFDIPETKERHSYRLFCTQVQAKALGVGNCQHWKCQLLLALCFQLSLLPELWAVDAVGEHHEQVDV